MMRKLLVLISIAFLVSGCRQKAAKPSAKVSSDSEKVSKQKIAAPRLEKGLDSKTEAKSEVKAAPIVNDGSWIVTASSMEKGLNAGMAVDGSMDTRWGSEFADDQWWMVDFGRPQTLERISINWEAAHAKTYKVLVSADGKNWDEVLDEQRGTAGARTISFDARPVRYVKIAMGKRATEWGFSIFEIAFNPRGGALGAEATASSGNRDYAPRLAIDGDMSTRWSSDFQDEQWWQVDFGMARILSGMKISWETAFSEKYEIQVSDDGNAWRTIYRVTEGDGQTDILFFKPVKTRFLRIACHQRGTGWGNSIYEIKFYDMEHIPSASASSTAPGSDPAFAIDGDQETMWRSGGDGEQYLEIRLPEKMNIGGMELNWGKNYPVSYVVEYPAEGKDQWVGLKTEEYGNGGKDYVFFPAVQMDRARIRCLRSNAGKGYELAQVELKSGEEQATPLRAYQAKARDVQRGRFLMWLGREQEFWTVVGVPDDSEESLLGETGSFEPKKGAFSVQPFVMEGDKLWDWADVKLDQKLEDGYLPMPTVTWKDTDWKMDISALAFGESGKSLTAVRYRLTNQGNKPRTYTLVLAVRPIQLNPVWQHGGMSPIRKAVCRSGDKPERIDINGATGLILPTKPEAMGAASLARGDVVDFLARGQMPKDAEASDEEGKVSVGMMYELTIDPGKSKDVITLYPLHDNVEYMAPFTDDPVVAFENNWNRERAAWKKELDRFTIDIPEKRLIETMKSNLGYVLINRDAPWFKPGSRNYNHGWIRDGALTGVAMLRLGKPELPGAFISHFSDFVNEDGWVPFMIMEDGRPCGYNPNKDGGEGHEFDSQGEFVFIVRQYYDFTGDKKLVEKVYPEVVKALKYGREIRKQRLTDEYKGTVYEGILPLSNSHEGYYPAKHSYWDDFWMLRGWKDGAYLAEQMGKPEDAAWMRKEESALRKSLLASIMAVIKRDNLRNIPGCAELGDEDPTSTSIAIMACDEARYLPQPYLSNTFERYEKRIAKRYTGTPDTFTPYEVRNADVFIRLGQRERALAMLRYFMKDSMRPHNWNELAEVVHAKPRAPSYIGDMPHTWVGSDYINAVRSIFSFVRDDTLVLAAGVDPAWLDEGVTVKGLPTQYGKIDYTMKKTGNDIVFEASGNLTPPNGFELPLPAELRNLNVTVNGEPVRNQDGPIRFKSLPVKITLKGEPF